MMGPLHPSIQRFFSMTRINHVDWAVAWPDGYTRPGLFPGVLQKLAASPPPPAMPHRPVGHVKRDRPARAGSRGAAVRPGRHAGSPDRARATPQAGAQRILDAVPPARDDVAAVSGQIRGTVTLGTTLHTGPLDLARVLANVRDRHPDVVIKSHQPKDGSVGSCNRSAAGQWISPYALAPPNMSPIRCRVEPLSTICLR